MLAGLCILPIAGQAQDKPPEAAAPPVAAADVSANFDGRITEASKLTDPETKFRALRTIRNDLTRAIDDLKAQRAALQDEIARLTATRKDLIPPPISSTLSEPTPEKVASDLAAATQKVKELNAQISNLAPGDPSAANLRDELARAETYKTNIEQYVDQMKRRKEFADRQAKDLEALDRKIDGLRNQETILDKSVSKLVASQGRLDDEINDTLRTDDQRNTFKTQIAFAFAMLVASVIGGFFLLSWKDEAVRRAIFSGESGIQFLTLFSVVIAIILFGITGILESKELAALLGGLSGYILGRVTSAQQRAAGAA